jgi:transposase
MQVTHERCAGLDVHKKGVTACVLAGGGSAQPKPVVRTFGTMTEDLLRLGDWLGSQGVTDVAMESTGVFWKPIYNLLEDRFELLLVNAAHMKAVPGRKTDANDAEWIADLLRHGLLRPSYIPDRPQRELRELTRYRTSLVRNRSAEVNRVQKVLEGANIKLASLASDVMGVSGRAMIQAMVEGIEDPKVLAELAEGKMRKKIPELMLALKGRVGDHQRFLLAQQLEHLDYLDAGIQQVGEEIGRRLDPFQEVLELLDTIPGVGERVAQVILAEMGIDVADHLPDDRHAAAWAGVAPGNNQSAGKQRSTKTRQGNPALKLALIESAQAAAHTKNNYLSAQYHRIAARRGHKRAIVAVAHSILVIAYHIIKDRVPYQDLGAQYFDERNREAIERRLVARLQALGNVVTLQPTQPLEAQQNVA